jgi:Ca2+/H+ antiporter
LCKVIPVASSVVAHVPEVGAGGSMPVGALIPTHEGVAR